MRPVEIEVLLLRTLAPPAAGLAYRVVRAPLDRDTPDATALRLAELAEPGVCHSTSWRSVRDTVVLTYAALPDPHPGRPAVPLDTPAVLCSDDPTRPTPRALHNDHVAAHAVRHLAYLAEHDPVIVAASGAQPGLWAALRRAAHGMPVGTHDQLLAGARRLPARRDTAPDCGGVPRASDDGRWCCRRQSRVGR